MRWLAVGMAFYWLASSANALELWLASGEGCNSCLLYQRAAQARGYGRTLRHAGREIPILSIDKNVIAADVLDQLPQMDGPHSLHWETALTVLVMDVGRVVFAGHIAESADTGELRHSAAVMFPPAEPAEDDPAVRDEDLYAPFFVQQWNLEYFVDVALGRRPRREPVPPVDLAAPQPAPLGARNVVLWGSADTPLANALFIPARLEEIRGVLDGAGLGDLHYVTLYGHGPGVAGNDTSYLVDGRTRFKRAELAADYGADAAGLNRVLTGVLEQSRSLTLLVQVGHSGPAGSPLWGHGLTLLPDDLARIRRESSNALVMVSGACHSGMFATAPTCGFFAAHPDVTASGCQLSPEALETSDDYLRHFFRGAAGAGAPEGGGRQGGLPTLYDAHWYASVRLEDHQLSYTTTDALIDAHFAAHPETLPESLSVEEIRAAATLLAPAEADAVAALTNNLAPHTAIPLTGYVEANRAAEEKLLHTTEMSSAERNRIAALPYKLVLPLLARRIAYARLGVNDAKFGSAAGCERRSLQDWRSSNDGRRQRRRPRQSTSGALLRRRFRLRFRHVALVEP